MGKLHRLLWLLVLCTATESAHGYYVTGFSGCYASVGGTYECPNGYYWRNGQWRWHHHSWRHHHGWRDYGYWHHHWGWGHYRPSMYRDYYTYAIIDGVVFRKPIPRTGASAMPGHEPKGDAACEKANADLRDAVEKHRVNPGSEMLRTAEKVAQEKAMQECIPPWMRHAAGLGHQADTPAAGSAL